MTIQGVFCSLLFLLLAVPIIYITACCIITFHFKAYKTYLLSDIPTIEHPDDHDENK